ncbi:MAG: tRNA (N(6)-L-threonylcarbamoyladenosine(37)-C(2))-methylthiotransferase MtaB [Lachnospiraceae bacterium]|nr:tRNA (N(6)-L-threonylcarbamoyladenosine(37)-C(2))-methylthiotransferase MtaB [Lachnospiraceae bacterium]
MENISVAFHTLGCKVNIYETEVMEGLVRDAGASVVPFDGPADFYVVNTCSVTNIADRKSRQMLRRPKAKNPGAVVVACGCYSEVEDTEKLYEIGVDIVMPNADKPKIVHVLTEWISEHAEKSAPCGKGDKEQALTEEKGLSLSSLTEHTRADVKVQDGCNQFCTYCIIPYARGRIRSKRPEDAVTEICALASSGVKEIVLTGIHLSSYGKDLEGGTDLLSLIRAVHAIDGIERIRLGSLEPRIVTEEFAKALSKMPKICPHFHLSLQSGCADTLRRMNRHYTPEEYEESCRLLRRYFDLPAITTDVIVGFPGETEEEFAASKAFVKKIGFYELHVFKYSRRKGTVADRMPDQIDEQTKNRRSSDMIALARCMSEEYRMKFVGRMVEVLTEKEEATGIYSGYTKEYIRVHVPASGPDEIVRFELSVKSLESEETFE